MTNITNEMIDADTINAGRKALDEGNKNFEYKNTIVLNIFPAMYEELTLKRNSGDTSESDRYVQLKIQGVHHCDKFDCFKHWWERLPEVCREKYDQSDAMSAFYAGMYFNKTPPTTNEVMQYVERLEKRIMTVHYSGDVGGNLNEIVEMMADKPAELKG